MSTITAPAKDWLTALNFIAPSFGPRPASPVLTHAYLTPKSGSVTGFDFVVRATSLIQNLDESSKGAPFLAPYRRLLDAIKVSTRADRDVLVSVTASKTGGEHRVMVEAGGYSIALEGADVNDFPAANPEKVTHKIEVVGRDLKKSINSVVTAACKDDTLPILNTVNFSLSSDGLLLLATDRYRLAKDLVPTVKKSKLDVDFLVSATFAKHLSSRLKADDEVLVELVNGDTVSFTCAGGTLSTGLTAGDYPKIKKMFDLEQASSFVMSTSEFLEAAVVAWNLRELNSPARLEFTAEGLTVHFNEGLFDGSKSPLIGCRVIGDEEHESWQAAFNPAYLVEALKSISSDRVALTFVASNKPAKIHPYDTDSSFECLLMPMRVPTGIKS